MVGIKSRVSVLGHVRGVARPARERERERERRQAKGGAREKWKAGKREPTKGRIGVHNKIA